MTANCVGVCGGEPRATTGRCPLRSAPKGRADRVDPAGPGRTCARHRLLRRPVADPRQVGRWAFGEPALRLRRPPPDRRGRLGIATFAASQTDVTFECPTRAG